jgi:putative hemolysin
LAPEDSMRPQTARSLITIPPPNPARFPASLPFSIPDTSEGVLVVGIAVVSLLGSGYFSTLRASLSFSHGPRVLKTLPDGARKKRLGSILERVDQLTSSAAILKIICDLLLVTCTLSWLSSTGDGAAVTLSWGEISGFILLLAPLLLLVTEALPRSLARAYGDSLLVSTLPTFDWIQWPLGLIVRAVESIRLGTLRAFGIQENSQAARGIVEGLRDVIEDASLTEDLDEAEREILGNVLEFGDVDVAAVMTPRTEVDAVDIEDGIEGALAIFAETRHSRLPVFDESIDTIIGTVTALDLMRLVANGELEGASLRSYLRPPFLVPETKLISDLLSEFRSERQKIAIVLDEYGGTAGMVTIYDVIAEIVGDIEDEKDAPDQRMREIESNLFEVSAGMHVTEVNEFLGLELPEESDFETLGGFVLSELGHLPKEGEVFVRSSVEYRVIEATDRRIFKVSVRRGA